MSGDNVIWSMVGGRFVRVGDPESSPLRDNFLIVCDYSDWSGFRTLEGCEAQFEQLLASGRPDRFYRVVERL